MSPIHPREIDPHHPRLPLGFKRNFKCHVNLCTMYRKIEWLCQNNKLNNKFKLVKEICIK
jgi:Ni,Fe-hydrogenase III large subunit